MREKIECHEDKFADKLKEQFKGLEYHKKEKKVEKEKKKYPHMLISVYINEDKEIEEIELIKQFVGGEYGKDLECNSDNYDEYTLEGAGLLGECKYADTLYHVYLRGDCYECGGWEYTEYDYETTILKVIPVIRDYSQFRESEDDFEEQSKLYSNDSTVEHIDYEGDQNGGFIINPNITYNDLNNFIKIIAKYDIKLAHRFANHYELKEALGELYDETRAKIEEKRAKFKNYIKYNQYVKFRFDSKGYHVKKGKKEDLITFEEIDAIDDEMLLTKDPEYILDALFFAPRVMDTLINKKEEEE